MDSKITDGLRRIADLIDPRHVRETERLQRGVWTHQPVERIPVVLHRCTPPDWPAYPYRETFENPDKMLWNQLLEARIGAELRDDRMLNVRVNYGLATVPSLFGAKVRVDDATTWVEPLHGSEAIREMVDRGMPDLTAGLGGKALETEAYFRDILHEHGLAPHVHMFQVDSQGPWDIACLLWGEEIYLALSDEPDLVHALLDLIVETSIAFVKRQKAILGEPLDEMYHWWYWVPGGVRVVDDTSITLSPAMYTEFSRPYNQRIFSAFGNGYIHYCGHGLQSQDLRMATPGLVGIETWADQAWHNPDFTLDKMWRRAAEHKVTICWIGPGLPTERPAGLNTGLVYGFWENGRTWADAPACLAKAREFWRNP